MSTPPVQAGPGPAVTTVVLLRERPRGIGGHLALIAEQLHDLVERSPELREVPALDLTLNGAALRLTTVPEALTDDRLAYAATQSPVRQLVEPGVVAHRGALEVALTSAADRAGDLTTLSNVTAAVAGSEDALGVYLPDLLGGTEVQYSGVPADPARAFAARRSTVAGVLETGAVPTVGLGVDIDGAAHQFVPGTDLVRGIPVLDLAPVSASR